jgi:hypothetical protein
MVAALQKPVDGSLQPIENSPPGIQTMSLGALLDTGSLLGTVGAKADPPMAGERHAMLKTNSVTVPNKKGAVVWAFFKGFDSADTKPHRPDDRCGSRGLKFWVR